MLTQSFIDKLDQSRLRNPLEIARGKRGCLWLYNVLYILTHKTSRTRGKNRFESQILMYNLTMLDYNRVELKEENIKYPLISDYKFVMLKEIKLQKRAMQKIIEIKGWRANNESILEYIDALNVAYTKIKRKLILKSEIKAELYHVKPLYTDVINVILSFLEEDI